MTCGVTLRSGRNVVLLISYNQLVKTNLTIYSKLTDAWRPRIMSSATTAARESLKWRRDTISIGLLKI